ncbi:MAG: hypothetical protein ACKOBY_09875 [Cyanobium sp.]
MNTRDWGSTRHGNCGRPATARQFYGQVLHHGYTGGHQLRSGLSVSQSAFVLDLEGLLNAPVPQIQLPQ